MPWVDGERDSLDVSPVSGPITCQRCLSSQSEQLLLRKVNPAEEVEMFRLCWRWCQSQFNNPLTPSPGLGRGGGYGEGGGATTSMLIPDFVPELRDLHDCCISADIQEEEEEKEGVRVGVGGEKHQR